MCKSKLETKRVTSKLPHLSAGLLSSQANVRDGHFDRSLAGPLLSINLSSVLNIHELQFINKRAKGNINNDCGGG